MPVFTREVPVHWSRPRAVRDVLFGCGVAVLLVIAAAPHVRDWRPAARTHHVPHGRGIDLDL